GTLGFNNGARVHTNTVFFKEEPADIVKVKVSGNGYSDETVVYFRNDASTGFDGKMDAHSFPSLIDNAPYIYSTSHDNMAINVLPEVSSVPMNVEVGVETGTYTIETVSNGEFDELYLEDLAIGTITDLNTDSYTFDYIPGIDSRFVLHFGVLGVDDNTGGLCNIYSNKDIVYVNYQLKTPGKIIVYDLIGKEIASKILNVGQLNKLSITNCRGYYIVKVVSISDVISEKVLIY
ncbi:MAG: hypothetical protein DRJ05_03375, partial [Bacteroidetes bacterium]